MFIFLGYEWTPSFVGISSLNNFETCKNLDMATIFPDKGDMLKKIDLAAFPGRKLSMQTCENCGL